MNFQARALSEARKIKRLHLRTLIRSNGTFKSIVGIIAILATISAQLPASAEDNDKLFLKKLWLAETVTGDADNLLKLSYRTGLAVSMSRFEEIRGQTKHSWNKIESELKMETQELDAILRSDPKNKAELKRLHIAATDMIAIVNKMLNEKSVSNFRSYRRKLRERQNEMEAAVRALGNDSALYLKKLHAELEARHPNLDH